MDILVRDVEIINKNTPVKAFGLVGVHPAELTYLMKFMSLEEAKQRIVDALNYAKSLLRSMILL